LLRDKQGRNQKERGIERKREEILWKKGDLTGTPRRNLTPPGEGAVETKRIKS